MFTTAGEKFEIYRLAWSTQTWSSTGVLIDTRNEAKIDTLWDGSKLYIVSATMTTNTSGSPELRRYSYNATTDTYSLDAGFPVTIVFNGMEVIVLAKDSTGKLWVTFTRSNSIWVAHTTTDDLTWGGAYVLPVANANNTTADDISAIISFEGKVGVMWGNQTIGIEATFFATHVDGAPDSSWTVSSALQFAESADDHFSLKSLENDPAGKVFAVAKTSVDNANDPLYMLLVLEQDDTWSSYVVGLKSNNHTRAILEIDEENRMLHVFLAAPCCSGGRIYHKQTSLDNPSFAPGMGTSFIYNTANPSSDALCLNNPTSTKQNLTSATELVVLAGAGCSNNRYYHNIIDLP